MYLYKFGAYDYEESNYIELCHRDKFTKKQFEQMIFESVDLAIKKARKNGRRFIHRFTDIAYDVKEYMLREFGFELLDYTQYWSMRDSSSIFYNDGMGYSDGKNSELRALRKYLKSKGYTREDDTMWKGYDDWKKKLRKEKKEKSNGR